MGIGFGCFPSTVLACSSLMGMDKGKHSPMEQDMTSRTVSTLALIKQSGSQFQN